MKKIKRILSCLTVLALWATTQVGLPVKANTIPTKQVNSSQSSKSFCLYNGNVASQSTVKVADHESHASHASHESHASHYSSRY